MASVTLRKAVKDRLDAYCSKHSKIKARVAEKAIINYLDKQKGGSSD